MRSRFLLFLLPLIHSLMALGEEPPPNIVYIMSDELAYFELGHMGNPYIKTPRIDQMAKEGLRFTHALAAAPVCAPLRGCLMTGKHSGHASVRANDGGTPLRKEEVTIASMLKQKAYATGGFGKWGAGGRQSTGVPEHHGFDLFMGYYDQVHAHSFYPPYLIRNSEEVPLKGNIGGRSGETYAHYEIMREGLNFIRENREKPFFAYFPITPPHGMYDIPADDPAWDLYQDEAWIHDPNISQDTKNYAAMVSMVDRDVGTILDLLQELGLEERTLVFFTGDNGGQDRFRSPTHPRGFFGPNVNPRTGEAFRGGKGNLYEGGLRIPFLVRWPGKVAPNRVSDLIFFQPDVMPTLAELTGTDAPEDIDGLSLLPEILGESQRQAKHKMLYWEFGRQTAVRFGQWKAVESNKGRPNAHWELFNLESDISESSDISEKHPAILAEMQAFAKASHEPVRPGTYLDPERKLHEKDRRAKWGSAARPTSQRPSRTGADARQSNGPVNGIHHRHLIPAAEMKLLRFSSENDGNERHAMFAIDGNPRTVWHSRFSPTLAKPPHELVIDLGRERPIQGFRYLARQDGGWNGAFAKTRFYVSSDASQFPDMPAAEVTFAKDKRPQKADCTETVTGRYVKITVSSEVNGGPWASAAEIGVIASP